MPGGKKGRVYTTTRCSSTDLVVDGSRRMMVNGVYWLLDLEIPTGGTKVDLPGKFDPKEYSFRSKDYWPKQNKRPGDFRLKRQKKK